VRLGRTGGQSQHQQNHTDDGEKVSEDRGFHADGLRRVPSRVPQAVQKSASRSPTRPHALQVRYSLSSRDAAEDLKVLTMLHPKKAIAASQKYCRNGGAS
jgi:hypothetical protein